jgi:hypothetical protein
MGQSGKASTIADIDDACAVLGIIETAYNKTNR